MSSIEQLEKYRKNPQSEEDNSSFTFARDSRQAVMLDLLCKDGKRDSLGYPYLSRIRFHSPTEMILSFTDPRIPVTLKGRNLLPLYKALSDHKVRSIMETGDPHDDLPENETVIYEITVGDGEE